MEFLKYQHVERFDTTETEGIDIGTCYIFSKLDGMNGRVALIDGKLNIGSRNNTLFSKNLSDPAFQTSAHIVSNNDVGGFANYVLQNRSLYLNYLIKYPNRILYGEFMKPHTLKTYRKDVWGKFYVFDIFDLNTNKYIPYEEYKSDLLDLGIEFIPPIAVIQDPKRERLGDILEKNTYLIEDGKGVGEGIVLKRYDFINKFGRTTWAKIVRNEFKDENKKVFANRIQDGGKLIEREISEKYMTKELFDKEKAKIEDFSSQHILQLLGTLYYTIVKEEIWEIVKKNKNPKIDFKLLQQFIFAKAKSYF